MTPQIIAMGGYSSIRCLGLLPGSHSPHYDDMNSGEYTYKLAYRKLIENGDLGGGIAADDGLIEKQLKPCYLSKKVEVT